MYKIHWIEGVKFKNVTPLSFGSMLTYLFSPRVCVLAVTLLDSMSALADLGWEAYPNEGVSIEKAHTRTHTRTQSLSLRWRNIFDHN